MRTTILGLALSLMGGAAFAQTPPAPPSAQPGAAAKPQPPGAMAPPMQPAPSPAGVPQAQTGPQAQNGLPPGSAGRGAPEGEIIETPQGFFIVRPGNANAMQLPPPRLGSADQGPAMDDDEAMDNPNQGRMPPPPPPPPPRKGPRHPPEGKGARFNIHAPNLDIRVKCPDDEPVKACVDAVSQLLDKASAQAH